jgi:predicted GIY-YIG superfamily endonuclease
MTTNEFAKSINVRPGTVKRWIHEGMPVRRLGSRAVVVDAEAAQAWVAEHRARSVAHGRDAVVYIAQAASGLVKIGFTSDLHRRLTELRADAGCAVEYLITAPGNKRLEMLLHSQFADARERGEWFRCEGNLAHIIEALRAA